MNVTKGQHVTAGTKTIHLVGGHFNSGTAYPPCSASFSGKTLKVTEAAVTCKVCSAYAR